MSNKITRCIACQSDKIRRKRGLFPVTVHGEMVKVPDVEYYACSKCGETFLDLDNETKIDIHLEHCRTQVSASRPS